MSQTPTDLEVVLPSGLKLSYRDWGGAGTTMLLLHGLASSSRIWDFVAPILRAKFRVLALDQRGHGRSDRPDSSFDFGTYVADLVGLHEELGLERSVLVGHSWGGNVALQFAVDRPEQAAGLVLVDGGFLELSARPGWTWERVEQELAPPRLDGLTVADLLGRVSQGDLADVWSPALAESVLGHFERLPDGTIRPWLRRDHHMRILRALWEQKPSRLWERVNCPVLLVPARRQGPDGRAAELGVAREEAVRLAESRLRLNRTVWMEETIHDVPLQRPERLAAAISEFVAANGL